jgi:hypothetical protein
MILVWTLDGTSLQHHMAPVHVVGLGEQLRGWQESSVTFEYCTVQDHSRETMLLQERFRKAQTLLDT